MTSSVYSLDNRALIESRTAALLDASAGIVAASPRGVGDAVQELLSIRFQEALGNLAVKYEAEFPRRAMADLAFQDADGFHHVVDVKTHRSGPRSICRT